MALVNVNPIHVGTRWPYATGAGMSLNAVGESVAIIGHMFLEGQTGSKTFSSAGAQAWLNFGGGNTWASGSTNLRIGFQDVNASGVEDGTFDVQADLVPGVETIANDSISVYSFESGTKTIAHGDLVAFVCEMTARGGTDAVGIDAVAGYASGWSYGFPYGTEDTGAGPAKTTNRLPLSFFKADDGTYAWINGAELRYITNITTPFVAFNSGSTPDEYAAAFKLPFACSIVGIGHTIFGVATTDTYELILYSDPFGTPVAQRTFAPDPDVGVSGAGGVLTGYMATVAPYTISADTYYAVALRPTSANNVGWSYYDMGSGNAILKRSLPFTECKMCTRTDNTGAFSERNTYDLPEFMLEIGSVHDGTGGGGGTRGYVG